MAGKFQSLVELVVAPIGKRPSPFIMTVFLNIQSAEGATIDAYLPRSSLFTSKRKCFTNLVGRPSGSALPHVSSLIRDAGTQAFENTVLESPTVVERVTAAVKQWCANERAQKYAILPIAFGSNVSVKIYERGKI